MHCFISGLCPPITDVDHKRRFDWNIFGCSSAVNFLETVIKESIKSGIGDYIILDRYIDIYDKGGLPLICLESEDTRPCSKGPLDVTELGLLHYRVELRKSSPRLNPSLSTPAFDEKGLKSYKYFKKGSNFGFHPHKIPASSMRHLNPFIDPTLTSDDRLSRQVGMPTRKFWELVDQLTQSGLKKRHDLSIPAMVSLYRTKLRLDIDFSLLSTMFGSIDEMVRCFLILEI